MKGFKFIIFIDDLSFEANEDEYKFLKSFIEGSIVNEADNIAFLYYFQQTSFNSRNTNRKRK